MIKKHWKKILITIIVLMLLSTGVGAVIAYADYVLNATQVTYDKDGNTIAVNEALDELYTKSQQAEQAQQETQQALEQAQQQALERAGIWYGAKTKETVVPGDSILMKVGEHVEEFTVGRVVDGKIVAVPKYNINASITDVRQADSVYTKFSSSMFWSGKGVNIDDVSQADIYPYLEAYRNLLAESTRNKYRCFCAFRSGRRNK